jgi:hypothetical protein
MKKIEQVNGHELVRYAPPVPALNLWQSLTSAIVKQTPGAIGAISSTISSAITDVSEIWDELDIRSESKPKSVNYYQPPRLDAYYTTPGTTKCKPKCCCPCHQNE